MVPVLLLALLTAAAAASPPPASPQAEPVCVVAHVGEGVGEVDGEVVRRLFLLRQRFWPDGTPAHPVNLPASSDVRERFSESVLGSSVRDLVPYWNERYFHGTRPPPSVASEQAVLLFLERTTGGVGYVSAKAAEELPGGVRRLFCTP